MTDEEILDWLDAGDGCRREVADCSPISYRLQALRRRELVVRLQRISPGIWYWGSERVWFPPF